jgi:hypothetical protein
MKKKKLKKLVKKLLKRAEKKRKKPERKIHPVGRLPRGTKEVRLAGGIKRYPGNEPVIDPTLTITPEQAELVEKIKAKLAAMREPIAPEFIRGLQPEWWNPTMQDFQAMDKTACIMEGAFVGRIIECWRAGGPAHFTVQVEESWFQIILNRIGFLAVLRSHLRAATLHPR